MMALEAINNRSLCRVGVDVASKCTVITRKGRQYERAALLFPCCSHDHCIWLQPQPLR